MIVLLFLSLPVYADGFFDQWEDSEFTYKDLVDKGFEVKAYNVSSLNLANGYTLILFVTVLQKEKEVFECQEYQTLDENLKTFELNLVCRKNVQPFRRGVDT